MKTYCTNCGCKVEHLAQQKPNFCPKCGYSFTGVSSSQQNAQINEENEEDEEALGLNVDSDFELEFELDEKPKRSNKLSDLMGTSGGAPNDSEQKKRGRGRPKKINKEKVWEDFKKEAGGNPHKEANE